MPQPTASADGAASGPTGRLLRRLRARPAAATALTHVEQVPARAGRPVAVAGLGARTLRRRARRAAASTAPVGAPGRGGRAGVRRPARRGRHRHRVRQVAGLPAARRWPRCSTDPRATVLYLSPTKALAADQLRAAAGARRCRACAPPPTTATPRARSGTGSAQHAQFVLTNPDMLHRGILPGHAALGRASCAGCVRGRRRVPHLPRGLRLARRPRAAPAAPDLRPLRRGPRSSCSPRRPSADPAVAARPADRAAGRRRSTDDASPRGELTFALWEPPLHRAAPASTAAPVRRVGRRRRPPTCSPTWSPTGVRTLAFVRSRRGAEVVALDRPPAARRGRRPSWPTGSPPTGPATCREERRALERAPARRRRCSGWPPPTRSSSASTSPAWTPSCSPATRAPWPRCGSRPAGPGGPGRTRSRVLVARDDPLDTYLVHHPEALFGRPVEATVLDPANPYVLGPHLCCAAAELPLTAGRPGAVRRRARRTALDELVAAGAAAAAARPAGTGRRRDRPDVDIRGTGGAPVARRRGGDRPAARHGRRRRRRTSTVHAGRGLPAPGRVLRGRRARPGRRGARWCTPSEPDWTTLARDVTDLSVVSRPIATWTPGRSALFLGDGRRDQPGRRRTSAAGSAPARCSTTRPLDLPPRQLRTGAVWWTRLAAGAGRGRGRRRPTCRARCTPPSTPRSACCRCSPPATAGTSAASPPRCTPTPGADGLRLRRPPGRRRASPSGRTGRRRRGCGPPATRSPTATARRAARPASSRPKCGNGNDPLDKPGAVRLLDVVLTNLPGLSHLA